LKLRTIFIFLTALSLLFATCGDDDGSGEDGPRIVTTTGILADVAGNVAPDAEIEQIIPEGANPHDFELSAQDRQTLEDADIVIAVGAGLEPGIPLDDVGAPVWELTANAGELFPFEEGGSDPHVWMDPTRVAAALPSLAEALAEVDADGESVYRRAADDYAAELRRTDRELRRELAAVPPTNRELITSHDSLAYFADRYGFEVVATAFPASGPEAEASAARLEELVEAVREVDAPAVFAGEEDDPEALRLVAEDAGVAIEDELLIESPGDSGGYVEMLRHDAGLIAAALG
jgi:zinc/manganese transport system substrate-binding protein